MQIELTVDSFIDDQWTVKGGQIPIYDIFRDKGYGNLLTTINKGSLFPIFFLDQFYIDKDLRMMSWKSFKSIFYGSLKGRPAKWFTRLQDFSPSSYINSSLFSGFRLEDIWYHQRTI